MHPINWSNDDFRDLGETTPLEACFQQMQEAGYVGTEVGHKYPDDPNLLRPMMDKFQLRLIGGWHSTYLAENEFEEEEGVPGTSLCPEVAAACEGRCDESH